MQFSCCSSVYLYGYSSWRPYKYKCLGVPFLPRYLILIEVSPRPWSWVGYIGLKMGGIFFHFFSMFWWIFPWIFGWICPWIFWWICSTCRRSRFQAEIVDFWTPFFLGAFVHGFLAAFSMDLSKKNPIQINLIYPTQTTPMININCNKNTPPVLDHPDFRGVLTLDFLFSEPILCSLSERDTPIFSFMCSVTLLRNSHESTSGSYCKSWNKRPGCPK